MQGESEKLEYKEVAFVKYMLEENGVIRMEGGEGSYNSLETPTHAMYNIVD